MMADGISGSCLIQMSIKFSRSHRKKQLKTFQFRRSEKKKAITNIYFGYQYYNVTKKYDLQQKNDVDYIPSPFFRGISFDELQADIHSDEEIMIYVGREDCGKCKEFEEEFEKILEQYDTEIPAYYTTQDRFQERRKEMYQYLDRYHIEKVPVIILTQDSEILRMWYDPVNSIPEIIQYL